MSTDQITDLKSLDDELAKDSMRGLWTREETLRREPVPFGKPVLWKWAKIRAGLEAVGADFPGGGFHPGARGLSRDEVKVILHHPMRYGYFTTKAQRGTKWENF